MNAYVKPPEVWPPNYVELFAWRQNQLTLLRNDPRMLQGARAFYKQPENCGAFINDWIDTYDPRNAGQEGKLTSMPFILFQRQEEMVQFLIACLQGETNGLIEKCRDAGATWVCVAVTVWLWLFMDGAAVGWGSRKEQLVDKIGDPDSIFEKIRAVIRQLPEEFLPAGFSFNDHMSYMKIINPESGATITGEAGDNIGRGGRKLIYFKDESAHYEHPDLIEAALGDNTRVQIDISSVNGIGNVFHRKRKNGVEWEPGQDVVKNKSNVFIFRWSDHPAKTLDWYTARRAEWEENGLLHKFAQEVDRDYSGSVEGVIIKAEWVRAAVDAHIKLGFTDQGTWLAGLDVADEGLDKSALAQRKGVVLKACEHWGQVDTGVTARRALQKLVDPRSTRLMYDCIGVGAGCKSEFNRLRSSDEPNERWLMPDELRVEPWNAADAVLFPEENIIKGDKNSPLNKDYYMNLKAQAWRMLSLRFYKTWRAVTEGADFDTEELISIDSTIKDVEKLIEELSQATSGLSTGRLKWMVNKKPDGSSSPNMADAVVMAYWPVAKSRYTLRNVG
ncbi:terminase large subunit protein [Rhizobium phage RHph_I72]|nr:terminase large subunit protein [Rhizobium phage RHph_I72]